MGKVKRPKRARRPKRHLIRNLPLKWSFMLYVLACALVAIVLALTAATFFTGLQSDLYYTYEAMRLREHGLTEEAIQGEVVMDGDVVLFYRTVGSVDMSPEDWERYNFYEFMSMVSIPAVSLLCILLTGFLFFNRKLRQPLQLINKASAQIAAGDLDFTIHYDNRNEMGRLATSIETMRAALQASHTEMWRMMEQRKQLNAAFAHDLRTPLTVLRGYTEYLKTYVPQQRVPEEKLLATVDLMHTYVTRLEGYTTSMSAMQRLEEVRPRPQSLDFAGVCKRLHSAADMLRGTAALHFVCEGEGSLSADPDVMAQVMENLVANAARYAARAITVDIRREGDMLAIVVSDDGPGFPQKVLSRGIVPYNHRKEEDAKSEHYGLGLYICAVLCQRHGGALTLPPEAGMSRVVATFRVSGGAAPRG